MTPPHIHDTVPSHIRGTALQAGPMIWKNTTSETFCGFAENADLLSRLNKRVKLFRGKDGWFAHGVGGQVWEYGVRKLGFTVTTAQKINIMIDAGFQPAQRGDDEANFVCEWTDENIGQLIRMLRLRVRRNAGPTSYQPL